MTKEPEEPSTGARLRAKDSEPGPGQSTGKNSPGTRRRIRGRDAARSKEAILDAAEEAFARVGFDAAGVAQIAASAGVSATLPTYFFGDKSALYDAVKDRIARQRNALLVEVTEAAADRLDGTEAGLREGTAHLVRGYVNYLRERPTFVRLLSRDALDSDRLGRADAPRHSGGLEKGLRHFIAKVNPPPSAAVDPDHLLISIVALAFFPLEHDETFIAGMGLRAWSDAFTDRRVEHVVDLLIRALVPDQPSSSSAGSIDDPK